MESTKKSNFLDYTILVPYLALSVFGIIMVFSTTVPAQLLIGASPYKLVLSQGIFMLISFVSLIIIYQLKIRALKSQGLIGIILFILILAMVYSRVGPHTSANGAHGWIPIPGVGTIQPAEFAKLFIIWYLSSVFSNKQEEIAQKDIYEVFKGQGFFQKLLGGWRFWIIVMIAIEVIMPDIGNSVIMLFLTLIMIAASGISYKWFTYYGRLLLLAFVAFIVTCFITGGNLIPNSYINKRFIAFVNPFKSLADAGHQLANSYYAISNGGWLGLGLGNSIEKKGYLPEATTDFIFPIIVEELGVIGAVLLLAIMFFLIIRILLVGIRARNPFNSLMAIGIASMLLLQVFINIGGATGLIPETGVTLPFISQGGSSFLIDSLGIGFALNISAHEKLNALSELVTQNQGKSHVSHVSRI